MNEKLDNSSFYESKKWRSVAFKVRQRDFDTCTICYTDWLMGRIMRPNLCDVVHHIKPLKDYPELGYMMDNLTCLCHSCHNKLHPERGYPGEGRRDIPGELGIKVIKL